MVKGLKISSGVFLLFTFAAHSASSYGKVEKLEFGPAYGSRVYVDITGSAVGSCATNQYGFNYHFDLILPAGNVMFSTLLAAQRSGTELYILGSRSCDATSHTEEIRWIQTK